MTNTEAIETLRANYPDACFEQLREAVDAAIVALKAQNASGDTISRQAAIDALYHVDEYNGRSIEAIRNLPSAERHGRWEPYLNEGLIVKCSVCGSRYAEPWHYCPNCGARMEV